LVGVAAVCGLFLREVEFTDGLSDCGDEHAFGGEFRSLSGRKADIFEHVPAALVKCLSHFSILRVQGTSGLQTPLD